MKTSKNKKRIMRHKRVRATVKGDDKKPRLCVFRSNQHIYAQIINDKQGKTIVSASDKEVKKGGASEVGKALAIKAIEKGIKEVVFDRAGYKYHGKVKLLADGAREGGLKF